MSPREKIMLASGMSLGVIAGACGITRTVVLSRLDVLNYTLNFVPYFAWAGAEIAVAMICVGIPTLRPLYLRTRGLNSTHDNQGRSNTSELPRFRVLKDEKPGQATVQYPPPSPPSSMESGLSKPANAFTRPPRDSSEKMVGPGRRGGVIYVQNEVQIHDEDAEWPLTKGSPLVYN